MKRKSFKLQLLDGKEYIFSERNMEDLNLAYLQDKIRADKVKFIQENIKNEDLQMPLLMQEMRAMYGAEEMAAYISSHKEEQTIMVYNSFKIENPEVSIEVFKPLVNEPLVQKLEKLIQELEKDEDINEKEIAFSLGVPEAKVISWRNEQPQVYNALKKTVKKNMSQSLSQEK
jgi:hypothetical protein